VLQYNSSLRLVVVPVSELLSRSITVLHGRHYKKLLSLTRKMVALCVLLKS